MIFPATAIILAGDRLLVLTERGELVLAPASPDGFQSEARARILDGIVRAHPALAAGKLYARDGKKLVCLDLTEKK